MGVSVAAGVRDGRSGGEKVASVCAVEWGAIASALSLRSRRSFPGNISLQALRPDKDVRLSVLSRKSSRQPCRLHLDLPSSSVASARATTMDGMAITAAIVHLCSSPYKALRFAPPAHTRGLRALTVPARR